MKYDLKKILKLAKERYVLETNGIHGFAHWERVRQNGLMLAEQNGADKDIVELFACFHDCCREDNGHDPYHGRRAAEFIESIRGKHLDIDDDKFKLLYEACEFHTNGKTKADVTVMTCWDADRLDLWRVGIWPDPKYLCNEYAKKKSVIENCSNKAKGIKKNKKR